MNIRYLYLPYVQRPTSYSVSDPTYLILNPLNLQHRNLFFLKKAFKNQHQFNSHFKMKRQEHQTDYKARNSWPKEN